MCHCEACWHLHGPSDRGFRKSGLGGVSTSIHFSAHRIPSSYYGDRRIGTEKCEPETGPEDAAGIPYLTSTLVFKTERAA